MSNLKKTLVLSILLLTVATAYSAGFIVLSSLGILRERHEIDVLLIVILPFVWIFAFAALFFYLNSLMSEKALRSENKYNLGIECSFFNYYQFQSKLTVYSSFHKNEQVYFIAFSASNQNIARNLSRNGEVTQFSGLIAQYLTRTFSPKNQYKDHTIFYCFYHGLFLIALFGNENLVRDLYVEIDLSLYSIAQKEDLRVFVQPFFGVSEKKETDDIFSAVDKAITARSYSEKNFEGLTFFNDSFLKESSVTDIEEITKALHNNEFVVYYQPKFNLTTKKFISSEALIRWNSPKYGLLGPGKFIQKAENGGLIHDIDMFVFKRVCEDLNETKRKGRRLVGVSINFSLYEFYSPNFVNDIINILKNYEINPSLIEIEITETMSQANTFLSISIMKKLKDAGMKVLMDDFGVGFSNISNLKKMPIDTVKIDKSFIDNIENDVKTREIVRFLISLCKVNGMEVVAEGVDNAAQVDILRRVKCDTIQGFYYSKPLSKTDYDKFLLENKFERKESA